MSLDKFVKPVKKQDGATEPQKPAAKPEAAKSEKPQKRVKKAPAKKNEKPAKDADEIEDAERPSHEDGIEADLDGDADSRAEEPAAPKESALKAMGMIKYALACPACKFKKELLIAGEPKPHQLLCKKCGGQVKAIKKG